jgi:hypothetical protein
VLPPALQAKIDAEILQNIKSLSGSPNWTPQHPKWADIEKEFRAEHEWILAESRKAGTMLALNGADALISAYQRELSPREQAAVLAFYDRPLGRRFLQANQEIGAMIQDIKEQLNTAPEALKAQVRPLTPENQARWGSLVLLTDTPRMVSVLLDKKLPVNPDEMASLIKISFLVRSSQLEAIRKRFQDNDLEAVAAFQQSPAGTKEFDIAARYMITAMAPLQTEIRKRIERLNALMSRWKNSPELN